jgi:hypothetical protein
MNLRRLLNLAFAVLVTEAEFVIVFNCGPCYP